MDVFAILRDVQLLWSEILINSLANHILSKLYENIPERY